MLPPKSPGGEGEDRCGALDFRGVCDGHIIRWCGADGAVHERDCAEHGLRCGWLDDDTGHWCVGEATPDAGSAPDAGSTAPDAGLTPPPRDAGVPALDGGIAAPPPSVGPPTCRDWPAQHGASGGSWGGTLTDIVQHLPSSYGSTYYDADHVTYGHETSHGIHAHIRNNLNDTGTRANGFYLPGNQACLVREPMMRKSDVGSFVPSNLRWSRYSLYISGSTAWDDTPLYVWDEWNAYVNGAEVGIERANTGLWTGGWRGTVDGVIEFVVYAIAVGMAAEAREPGYFAREPNFLPFLAFNLERSMRLFREGQGIEVMRWDEQDDYDERLRSSSEAEPMRAWVRGRFGPEWTSRVMGF